MSNMSRVQDAIAAGHTRRPEIARETGLTEPQVQSALQNLVRAGRVRLIEHRQRGQDRGKAPGIYGLGDGRTVDTRLKATRRAMHAVSSVFDLGARA